jgi:hypothetical protein
MVVKSLNFKIIALTVFISAFCACRTEKDGDTVETLVKAQSAGTLTAEQIKLLMIDYVEYRPFAHADINIYNVEYNTACDGDELKVSGLFIIPSNVSAQTPVVVYNHGTIGQGYEPSWSTNARFTNEAELCYIFASVLNCVILMPDYIGYGVSSYVEHPYIHAETLGQTSLDIIRAYNDYTKITPGATAANKNVIIAGYSEGGYASVALHKKIQETTSDIHIVKTYAGAGPYDIENFVKEALQQDKEFSSIIISSYLWVLSTYKEYSGYTKPFDEIYSEEDNEIFKNNNYSFGYLVTYPINRNPKNLFKPDFIDLVMEDKDVKLSSILKENTLSNFVPSDSLILFHSEADSWISVSNTNNTYNKMKSKNAPVRCEIIPKEENKDHDDAVSVFLRSTILNMISTQVLLPR